MTLRALEVAPMFGRHVNHLYGVDFPASSAVFLTVRHSAWLLGRKAVSFCGFHTVESKTHLLFVCCFCYFFSNFVDFTMHVGKY